MCPKSLRWLSIILLVGWALAGCGSSVQSNRLRAKRALKKGVKLDRKLQAAGYPKIPIPYFREEFIFKSPRKQDFLFVFDGTKSMLGKNQEVIEILSAFFERLEAKHKINWQFSAIVTDVRTFGGQLVKNSRGSDVIRNDTSMDAISEAKDLIRHLPKPKTGHEQGLESLRQAIDKHNLKFMRQGVPLAVIVPSNAEDQSGPREAKGVPQKGFPLENYIEFFKMIPEWHGAELTLFPIVTVKKNQCTFESLGLRYMEVQINLETGFTGNICNLKTELLRIAHYLSKRGYCYRLNGRAMNKPEQFQVETAMQSIEHSTERGFFFDTGANSICFGGNYVPQNGTRIRVTYPGGRG